MKTKAWINAFRLRTLPLAISAIVAGTASSFHKLKDVVCDDCPPDIYNEALLIKPTLIIFLFTLLTTLLLQILSNLANDYGDYMKGTDNVERIGPTRALQGGGITKKEMFRAIILFASLSFISGLSLLYFSFSNNEIPTAVIFVAIGILCIIAAIKYTMGKNAYGYRALGDFAVILFFGGIGILGTQYLQIKMITHEGIYIALAFGFWSAAVLNLNNMRDVENDIEHKKFTLAYYFGLAGSKIYQFILVIIPYMFVFLAMIQTHNIFNSLCVFALLPLSLMMIIAILKVKNRKNFDKFLKIQAILTLLNSIVLFSFIYLLHA